MQKLIKLDKYNHNMFKMTGNGLQNLLTKVVTNTYQPPKTHFFHSFATNQLEGEIQVPDPKNYFFRLTPNPTNLQPYNGVISFPDENSLKWEDLRPILLQPEFRGKYKSYLKNEIEKECFQNDYEKAFVLLSFEIARREKEPTRYPVTQVMTQEAVDKVMLSEEEFDKKKYEKQVDWLMELFCAKWNENNKYNARKDAYEKIMGISSSVDDISDKLSKTSIKE